jgi:hypothetical protein
MDLIFSFISSPQSPEVPRKRYMKKKLGDTPLLKLWSADGGRM